MGTPATTTRVTPTGLVMENGFGALVAFERDPDVFIWEKEVTPNTLDGGDPIDISTNHNVTGRTKAARVLVDFGEISLSGSYDPVLENQIRSNLVNRNGAITLHYPDGSTYDFFGYLRTFERGAMNEEGQPETTFTIVITNIDPSDGSESLPVLTEVAGT